MINFGGYGDSSSKNVSIEDAGPVTARFDYAPGALSWLRDMAVAEPVEAAPVTVRCGAKQLFWTCDLVARA